MHAVEFNLGFRFNQLSEVIKLSLHLHQHHGE